MSGHDNTDGHWVWTRIVLPIGISVMVISIIGMYMQVCVKHVLLFN